MELRADRLQQQLDSEPLRPAYLIAGAEPLRVLEAADAVRARARAEGYAEREVFDVDARFDWNQIDAGFSALSLFASRRLFDVRLPTGRPGKDGADLIARYCADPAPDTVLLITCGDWSKSHAGKWAEAVSRVGHYVPVWPLKPHELPDWLARRLRANGVQADAAALARLVERVEGNLLAAAQEVDKLALLAEGRRLDVETMESLVADSARYDVFRLVEAALAGEGVKALRMLRGLRAEGEAVPALMGWIAGEMQRVAGFARVADRGGNLNAEFKAARVWESRQASYKRAIARHPVAVWERLAIECGRVDRIAKGREQGDAWLVLERVLAAAAEPKARRLLANA
ncbi:DNA polymerase III subunit delta [Coralloluteibacterium thermophilus]|uniref:DNA polymerase III subunit delta n=1 Tax=Coralloluteibacterium thermophilum TaxID=2707049 RepID=A0ABV9NM43_9GAMM